MHVVSAILRRYLLQHLPVAVEGIGTLHAVRSSARFLPGQRLEPPRRYPALGATEPDDLPLVQIVEAELALDPVTADSLCREWREAAYVQGELAGLPDGSLLLEGIGTIEVGADGGGAFFPQPEFLEMLNPLPAEPVVVPSPSRRGTSGSGTGRPVRTAHRRPNRGRPKTKNPHSYTVSFIAVLVVLAALGYLCYYLWAHTDLFSGLLPR